MTAPPSEPKAPSEDFRDHLATSDDAGRRKWVFARQPEGRFYQRRVILSWALLGALFLGPFIKLNGNPLLMLNIVTRRFSILGHIFWPQDMALAAVALLIFFTGIMIFTSAYGRLWCGWVCPQTLLMEMVFRRIEYGIDGDHLAQRKLAQAPWTAPKIARRAVKHAVFFGVSFVIANLLLAYVIGVDQLAQIVTDNPGRHVAGLFYLLMFTGVFYAIFARFREQACTYICPYGRFQSTVVDENTMVVAYDHKRSDCVDCELCVAVCPTGIDIRNGLQMECVNCTACIDACDGVMAKVKRPPGLIRYASLNSIERGIPFKMTPRMIAYAGVLTALIALFLAIALTRPNVEATLLRAPGALFQNLPDGNLVNLYTLQLVNKTSRPMPVQLKLEDVPGKLSIMGEPQPVVPPEQLSETSILIELAPDLLRHGPKKFNVGVYVNGTRAQTVRTTFIGPRD